MALHLIIFDCDGVLLESVDAKTQAYAKVAAPYGQEASDKLVAHHKENGGISRTEKFTWFVQEVLQQKATPEVLRHLVDLFTEYSLDDVMRAQPVHGIMGTLEQWAGKVPLFVASGAPHLELMNVLKQQKMADFFQGIYGSPPGKVDLLRGILAETGVHPSNALMVGDSGTDMYAAQAVQTRFYGRGEYFRHTEYPWHKDMGQLHAYLLDLYNEVIF